jgi:thiol-disulfide isomerase/thioredoxin
MFKRTALLCIASGSLVFLASAAHAITTKPFSDAEFAQLQAAGKPVAVHFTATWCPTCKAQDKSLAVLAADPALKGVTILKSDYDQSKALQKQMNVKSQSTFVVFKGKAEVVRSSGATDVPEIKTLLTKAL